MNETASTEMESLAKVMQAGDTPIADFVEGLDLEPNVADRLSLEIREIDAALLNPQDSPLPTIVAGRWA